MSTAAPIPFRVLLAAELRRCLWRRAVHVLVGIALLGITITGAVAFVTIDPADHTRLDNTTLARLGDLWISGGDATLVPPIVLLTIGALIGGAVIVGGEWKAGTVTTLSTWEVRRHRLLGARLLACGLLAPAIATALLVGFVAATLPTVLSKGSAGGIDGAWAVALAGGVGRSLIVVSLAAVLGGAIASLGRSTAPALAALFVYNAVVEPVVRQVWPRRAGWLLGENLTLWMTGRPLDGVPFERSTVVAGITLALYVAAIAAIAVGTFQRRDLTGAG